MMEIQKELGGVNTTQSENLRLWDEKQGVFLINTVITVWRGEPKIHAKCLGLYDFTDAVIEEFNNKPQRVAFLIW